MFKKFAILCLAFMLCTGPTAMALAQDLSGPCPWTISAVRVGKWTNGSNKAGVWLEGSFPILPGSTERPDFYINGNNVGKSSIQFNYRHLPYASSMLLEGSNTITVQFQQSPYAGASDTLTISNFSWSDVPIGGYKSFK